MKPDFSQNTKQTLASQLPSAYTLFDKNVFKDKQPVIFLDFDGTLAPIVNNPEDACLSPEMYELMKKLLEQVTCVILTGRDRADIEKRIDLRGMIFAGSHGYEIKGRELDWVFEEGLASVAALDDAQNELETLLAGEQGVTLERKKFAIAVHYRHVPEEKAQNVVDKVQGVISQYRSCLKPGPGKKVLELKPNCEWNKGKALEWLMNKLNFDLNTHIPVFIGDDLTDEDAFAIVQNHGVGIVVCEDTQRYTRASYSLATPEDVYTFLNQLSGSL